MVNETGESSIERPMQGARPESDVGSEGLLPQGRDDGEWQRDDGQPSPELAEMYQEGDSIRAGVLAREDSEGAIDVWVDSERYGQTGEHWKETLEDPDREFGTIRIEREDAAERRDAHTRELRDYHDGHGRYENIDEAPGAMFHWDGLESADAEFVDAESNQRFGRDLGQALQPYENLQEVRFHFL